MKKFFTGLALAAMAVAGGVLGSGLPLSTSAQVWKWSQTAGTNASVDSAINWAEGQAPSSINDSARAMMARLAQWRDDSSGALTTGGTSTAYTLTTNSTLTALTAGFKVCFAPHAANGATPTLAIDGTAAKPLRSAPATALNASALVAGTPYCATYFTSNSGEYILDGAPQLILTPWSTGDVRLTLRTSPQTGWVIFDDGTIGNASSGASNRANADTSDLFAVLFNNVSDANAPLTGCSSGANTRAGQSDAATAFSHNCKIALVKTLGRALALSGSGSGLTTRALGASAGAEAITLAQNQLPNVTLPFTSSDTFVYTWTISTAAIGGSSLTAVQTQNVKTVTGSTSSINGGVAQQSTSVLDPTAYFNAEVKL